MLSLHDIESYFLTYSYSIYFCPDLYRFLSSSLLLTSKEETWRRSRWRLTYPGAFEFGNWGLEFLEDSCHLAVLVGFLSN